MIRNNIYRHDQAFLENTPKNGPKNSVNKQEKSARGSASAFFNSQNISKSVSFKGAPAEKIPNWIKGKTMKKILQSKNFHWLCEKANNEPGIMETLVAVGIVCTLRPAAILATPGSDKRDKQYAAAKSWASAIIDLGVTMALLDPIKRAYGYFEKDLLPMCLKDPKKAANLKYMENKTGKASASFIVNYGPKFITVPIRAAVTIALIPVIMRALFPKKDAKKQDKEKNNNNSNTGLNSVNNNIFKAFKGSGVFQK